MRIYYLAHLLALTHLLPMPLTTYAAYVDENTPNEELTTYAALTRRPSIHSRMAFFSYSIEPRATSVRWS